MAELMPEEANAAGAMSDTLPQPQRGNDITESFTQASAALNHGQLIKDEGFTLFESVAALEIMDPKMDSGYSIPDQDSVLSSFDPLDYSAPEEVLWIMDELLCAEMTWHDGYPLSQTLLPSLHMHNILSSDTLPIERLVFHSSRKPSGNTPLVTDVLRTYCLAIAKCCDFVILEVTSEHYYEEEDFMTANFTRDLLTSVSEQEVVDLIQSAIATVDRLKLSADISAALKARLEIKKLLLQAFRPNVPADGSKAKVFESVKGLIRSLKSSHELSRATAQPVFSERVQRSLASNTPPRPLKQTPWEMAIQRLSQICDDTIAAFAVMDLCPELTPPALMRFSWEFTSRRPQPLTYSRAVMQGLLFKNSTVLGQLAHLDWLVADIRLTVLPAGAVTDPINWQIELPSSPRYRIARIMDEFFSRALEEFLHLYRMCLQNRCRIRRNFAQSVGILDGLQIVAEDYDVMILNECRASASTHDPIHIDEEEFLPLTNWVYYHKLQVMQVVVQMGFELDIYLPDELASSYALLFIFANEQAQHCDTITSVLERRLSSPTSSKPKPLSLDAKREIASSIGFLAQQAIVFRIRATLASALGDFLSLLQLMGLLRCRPACTAEAASLRHELRLKPFLHLGCPDLPSAEQLAGLTTARPPGSSLVGLTQSVDARLRAARADLAFLRTNADPVAGRFRGVEKGWRAEIVALERVAVLTAVGVSVLGSALAEARVGTVGELREEVMEGFRSKYEVDIPVVEKRAHEWWVVPKVGLRKGKK